MLSDAELWGAWRAGDTAAGGDLVQRHFLAVYRFFSTKIPDEADDLSQATFAACIEAGTVFRGESGFRAFVLGVARKLLLRHLEGRGAIMRGRAVSEVSMADLVPSPSSIAAHAEHRELLIAAMRTIPLGFQMVLELHYWEGMGTQDIADVLELPIGTVKSRLARARGRLRDALAGCGAPASATSVEEDLRAALGSAR